MKSKDIALLAALAAGAYGLKKSGDKATASEQSKGPDPFAVSRTLTAAELSAAKRQAAREELNQKDRIGGPRSPMVDSSGNPVTTGTGGFAFTEDIPDAAVSGANFRRNMGMKKGGAVKKHAKGGAVKSTQSAASKRADGIAQRGKTRGRIV